ncbi:stress response protein nst1 [Gigaspora margarita]|uniref:Stress response protein nst1 n=1 Tax=Gigaspora margarita TaxID=4874 RepID=A0A8H4A1U4_GIGMA|nr:stress response protein nst1 [Gigaspora margarita]
MHLCTSYRNCIKSAPLKFFVCPHACRVIKKPSLVSGEISLASRVTSLVSEATLAFGTTFSLVEPSGTPLSPTSPPSKDPGELTPSHSIQNSNGTTKKEKKEGQKKATFEDPDIANGSHNQHTKSHHNHYNSDFDGEEVVDVNIEDDEEFFLDDEGYDPEAPEISFPCKDSITIFDGDNHNVPSTPAKKKEE